VIDKGDQGHGQAAAWFSVQRRGLMSHEEQGQLEAWSADADNRAALEGMHALWGELAALKDLSAPSAAPLAAPRAARPIRRGWPAALAACVLAAVAGALWWQIKERPIVYTAKTAIGEQRSATLPDGSRIELNVVTQIDYRQSAARRDVRLVEGEALFLVHKDAARPFIVRAGDYAVRAVGTAFDVRARDGEVQVSMLGGVVSIEAVAGPQAGHTLVAHLTQGERVSLGGASPGAVQIERIPVQAVAEWREHTVSYEDVPVAQIVADMNRFFARPLQVDPALANRRVTLRLQVQDREETLATLSALLDMTVRRDGTSDTLIGPP
jgi:transmembrane sensor